MTRKDVEELLTAMRPSGLSQEAALRMKIALGIEQTTTAAADHRLDTALHHLNPMSLSPAFHSKLLDVVSSVPFQLNEKVVMFPATAKEKNADKPRTSRPWIGAAACAVFGSLMAFVLPNVAKNQPQIGSLQIPSVTQPKVNPSNITASRFNTELENVEDRGVVWSHGSQPMRMLRVAYQDKILLVEPGGADRHLTLPREEVILIPEKID